MTGLGLGVAKVQKIVDWMNKEYPDQILTHRLPGSIASNSVIEENGES
ncbi:MAG: hypothetical protein ACLTOV_00025 [Phocaeicola sp.]